MTDGLPPGGTKTHMARVVQLTDGTTRRVALVDEPALRLVDAASSIYELAMLATETGDALYSGGEEGTIRRWPVPKT